MAWEIQKSCCIRDRISFLPDEIIGHILSFIPTKDVVKTSTLSKRWKSEWTFVPAVQLQDVALFSKETVSDAEKAVFMNYFDVVLNQVTFLRRLRLCCSCVYDISRLQQLIHLVISKLRKNNNVALEELVLIFGPQQTVKLPSRIFTSKKLVILKLFYHVELKFPSVVCLPSLKVLHLRPWYRSWETMKCMDVSSVENILAGCPNLEELALEVVGRMRNRLKKKRLCVQSSCLKRLTLELDGAVLRIEIEASNLEEVVLIFDMPKQSVFLITSLPLLTRARLIQSSKFGAEDKDYCGKTLIELLRKVSNTKDLFLSFHAMMCLEHGELYQQVPIFKNLLHLELQALPSTLPILPCLFKNWPNLVSFTLTVMGIPLQSHSTPNCLTTTTLHHLQKVDLSYHEACDHEMELVTYLLKNAPVLKKMVLEFKSRTMEKNEASLLYNTILNIPKASIACEVVCKIYDSKYNISFP